MTEIRVQKKHGVLVPSLPQDEEYFESIPSGEILAFDFRKPRNAKFHNKYFAMLNVVVQHTETWENVDQLREIVLIATGHCVTVWDPMKGRFHHVAKSINWAQLDDVKFNRIYQDSLTIIMQYFLPEGYDEDTFDQALNEIMDFA